VLTAVLFALAGACAFAVSTVVQHRTAADISVGGGGRWLVRLVRRPAWLAAEGAGALGAVLHAAALRSGPVALVQPLLAGGLVVALALGALVDRRHPGRPLPGRRQWCAAVAVAAGLTWFLLAARPTAGTARASSAALGAITVAALLVVGLAVWWSRRPARPHRALVRGAAAGICFALTGLLLKQAMGVPLWSWTAAGTAVELATVAVVGIAVSQAAFAAGALVESLPVTTVLEPAIGVLLAGPLFGEVLLSGTAARLGQVGGALLLGAGLALLARRGTAGADDPLPEPFRRQSEELATIRT
jgi:hypothetical protein